MVMCQGVASGYLFVWGVVSGEGCLVSQREEVDYGFRRYSMYSLSSLSFSLSLSIFSMYSFSKAPESLMNHVSLHIPFTVPIRVPRRAFLPCPNVSLWHA